MSDIAICGDGEPVRLELAATTLNRLLETRQLCAVDFRCLDCESKQRVWRMCLMNCAKYVQSEPKPDSPCQGCGGCERGGPAKVRDVPVTIHPVRIRSDATDIAGAGQYRKT